ncbi:MAG: sugar phosphate isomerase/epimerase, partial [Clostridia bacterium]|nr:sugar phosphate isomerase/epimerase [Clostridia bacterium]
SAIGSPLGKIRLDEDMDAHMEMAKQVFESANVLGAKYVRMFSFYAPEGEDITSMKEQVAEALGRMLAIAKSAGVTLCHENEAKIYGDIPARCRELLDCFGGELKCVFDMGNFVLEGVDPYPAYELLKPYIAYFHIKDALAAGAIVPPGKGEAKIREILTAHSQTETDDFFATLEPHLQTFSGLNALVGRSFENPYQYPDAKVAFADAVTKIKELI